MRSSDTISAASAFDQVSEILGGAGQPADWPRVDATAGIVFARCQKVSNSTHSAGPTKTMPRRLPAPLWITLDGGMAHFDGPQLDDLSLPLKREQTDDSGARQLGHARGHHPRCFSVLQPEAR